MGATRTAQTTCANAWPAPDSNYCSSSPACCARKWTRTCRATSSWPARLLQRNEECPHLSADSNYRAARARQLQFQRVRLRDVARALVERRRRGAVFVDLRLEPALAQQGERQRGLARLLGVHDADVPVPALAPRHRHVLVDVAGEEARLVPYRRHGLHEIEAGGVLVDVRAVGHHLEGTLEHHE